MAFALFLRLIDVHLARALGLSLPGVLVASRRDAGLLVGPGFARFAGFRQVFRRYRRRMSDALFDLLLDLAGAVGSFTAAGVV